MNEIPTNPEHVWIYAVMALALVVALRTVVEFITKRLETTKDYTCKLTIEEHDALMKILSNTHSCSNCSEKLSRILDRSRFSLEDHNG